jgi:hypothetical protein
VLLSRAGHPHGVSTVVERTESNTKADPITITDREYRFILTFIVGASIVISLIGRGEVSAKVGRMPGAVDRVKALREGAQDKLAEEEEARIAAKKDAAASDDRDKH